MSSYVLDFNAKLGQLVQDYAVGLILQPPSQPQQPEQQKEAMQGVRGESLDIPVVAGVIRSLPSAASRSRGVRAPGCSVPALLCDVSARS